MMVNIYPFKNQPHLSPASQWQSPGYRNPAPTPRLGPGEAVNPGNAHVARQRKYGAGEKTKSGGVMTQDEKQEKFDNTKSKEET